MLLIVGLWTYRFFPFSFPQSASIIYITLVFITFASSVDCDQRVLRIQFVLFLLIVFLLKMAVCPNPIILLFNFFFVVICIKGAQLGRMPLVRYIIVGDVVEVVHVAQVLIIVAVVGALFLQIIPSRMLLFLEIVAEVRRVLHIWTWYILRHRLIDQVLHQLKLVLFLGVHCHINILRNREGGVHILQHGIFWEHLLQF